MKKLLLALSFFLFATFVCAELVTIKNKSSVPIEIFWTNGMDSKKWTVSGGNTLRFNQGGQNGNGEFHLTAIFGLKVKWNPRSSTVRSHMMCILINGTRDWEVRYSAIPF